MIKKHLTYEDEQGKNPIYIDDCNYFIIELLEGLFNKNNIDIHLQEYESFEDAYKVALDMRECNPLCYNQE